MGNNGDKEHEKIRWVRRMRKMNRGYEKCGLELG